LIRRPRTIGGAWELSDLADKVYLVHRRDEFRGDEVEVERVQKQEIIEPVLSSVATEVLGDQFVTGLVVENVETKEKRTLEVDGVFVEIGFIVDSEFVFKLLGKIYFEKDEDVETWLIENLECMVKENKDFIKLQKEDIQRLVSTPFYYKLAQLAKHREVLELVGI